MFRKFFYLTLIVLVSCNQSKITVSHFGDCKYIKEVSVPEVSCVNIKNGSKLTFEFSDGYNESIDFYLDGKILKVNGSRLINIDSIQSSYNDTILLKDFGRLGHVYFKLNKLEKYSNPYNTDRELAFLSINKSYVVNSSNQIKREYRNGYYRLYTLKINDKGKVLGISLDIEECYTINYHL